MRGHRYARVSQRDEPAHFLIHQSSGSVIVADRDGSVEPSLADEFSGYGPIDLRDALKAVAI